MTKRYKPLPHQLAVQQGLRRSNFLEMHRRAGKTFVCTDLAARQLVLPLPDRTIIYLAPYLKQARQVAWEYFRQHLHGLNHIQFKSSENMIVNTLTGSRIILSGMKDQTADSLRGLGAHFVVVDEMSGYSHEDFHSILLPIVAQTRGTIILSGTPPPYFTLFQEQRDFHRQMSIARPDEYAFFSFPITATDVFTAEEQEDLRRKSPSAFAREYRLDTESGDETTFAPLSLLDELINRDPMSAVPDDPPVCGWDTALKVDNSAFVIRHDHQITMLGNLQGTPSEQVNQLYRVMCQHDCRILAYDQGGIGHSFDEPLDRLTTRDIMLETYNISFQQRASDPSKFLNVRSEIYHRLKMWLHSELSCLPGPQHPTLAKHAHVLLEDIAAQRVKPNDKNLFQLARKEEIRKAIGRSPDFSDALALTFLAQDPADPFEKSWQDVPRGMNPLSAAEIMERHPELYPERWR